MYIIKNAIWNLGRNKGRNILLGVVLFFIIAMAAVSIVIQTSANLMIDHYKARFGAQVFLIPQDSRKDLQELKPALLLQFGESDFLQSSEYTAKSAYAAKGMKAVDEELETGLNKVDGFHPKGKIYGSSGREISEEFRNGTRVIVSGRKYQNDRECLISRKFAELNGLSVGNTLTLENVGETGEQEMEIVGIYEDLSMDAETNTYGTALGNRANDIFTALGPVVASSGFSQMMTLNAKFYLKDPSDLAAFRQELLQKGLPANIQVGIDEYGYQKIAKPVEGLKKIAGMFLTGVLILGSVVLILISVMAVRERKYEVGVLRAMGMKKGKVAFGMLSEVIVITILCLVLGLGTASWVSKPIAGAMLKSQMEVTKQADESDKNSGLVEELAALNSLQPRLEKKSITWMVMLSGVLAVISSVSGVLFIMRYEPRKILSERE